MRQVYSCIFMLWWFVVCELHTQGDAPVDIHSQTKEMDGFGRFGLHGGFMICGKSLSWSCMLRSKGPKDQGTLGWWSVYESIKEGKWNLDLLDRSRFQTLSSQVKCGKQQYSRNSAYWPILLSSPQINSLADIMDHHIAITYKSCRRWNGKANIVVTLAWGSDDGPWYKNHFRPFRNLSTFWDLKYLRGM